MIKTYEEEACDEFPKRCNRDHYGFKIGKAKLGMKTR